jgi:hypothetical protein
MTFLSTKLGSEPMINMKLVLASLCALVASGCATVSVDRAIGASSSGKSYVATLKKVNDLALDTSIEFTVNLLPALPRTEETLEAATEEIRKRTLLIGNAHEYLDGLGSYFSELDALAKGDQSEATANALGQVAESLKGMPFELKLSDEKETAITGLARFVAKQIHASAVEKALIRDADTVAQALAISEEMLSEQIRWIRLREASERKRQYIDEVRKPFLSGGQLGSDWKRAWSSAVRTPPIVALLSEAKKASDDMQRAWVDILRGQYSFNEIQSSLQNVKAGIEALTALKNAK